MIYHSISSQDKREHRVRQKLVVTADRPRLTVLRSNQHISAQIINKDGQVLCSYTSLALKKAKGTKVELATQVGQKLGELAKAKNVTQIVFDRGGYKFHGRVKALAEGVRQSGINF